MDADRIREIQEAEAAATGGPWRHGFADGSGIVEEDRSGGGYIVTADDECVVLGADDGWSIPQGVCVTADAYFIALARTAVPELLAEVKELVEAMSDPFLVILESHPNADGVANAEMSRAAKRFRDTLAAYRPEQA